MEIIYFFGAFVLLAALIYGTVQWHYRRPIDRQADEIVRDRYRRDDA